MVLLDPVLANKNTSASQAASSADIGSRSQIQTSSLGPIIHKNCSRINSSAIPFIVELSGLTHFLKQVFQAWSFLLVDVKAKKPPSVSVGCEFIFSQNDFFDFLLVVCIRNIHENIGTTCFTCEQRDQWNSPLFFWSTTDRGHSFKCCQIVFNVFIRREWRQPRLTMDVWHPHWWLW